MAASCIRLPQAHLPLSDSSFDLCNDVNLDLYNDPETEFVAWYIGDLQFGRYTDCKFQPGALSHPRNPSRSLSRSVRAVCSSVWYCDRTSTKPSPTSYPCRRSASRPRSPSVASTSRTLFWRPKSGTRRWRLDFPEDDALAVPRVRNGRLIALVAQLEAPDAVLLNWGDAQLGLRVRALEPLQQGDAVQHDRPGDVDGVHAAALARAVDA